MSQPNPTHLRLSGVLFMIGGAAFLAAGFIIGQFLFFAAAAAMLVAGVAFIAMARSQPPQETLPPRE